MAVERITELSDPRLDVFRDLKPRNAVRDAKLFVAEGPTVVERLLRSRFQVRSVLISDRKFAGFESRLVTTVPVYRVTDAQAREIVGFDFHAGVMASAERQPGPALADVIPPCGEAVIVAGDRVTDPENVGALIRIASAFGAAAVVLGSGSADPFSRRVLRVSMGNGLFLPVIETDHLPTTIAAFRQDHDFDICAMILDATAEVLRSAPLRQRTLLLFGNEYDGLSGEVLAEATRRLTIPMLNGTDSLNVAVCAGIALYELRSRSPRSGLPSAPA